MSDTQTIGKFLTEKWKRIDAEPKDWVHPPFEYWLKWHYNDTYRNHCVLFDLEPLSFPKWLLQPVPTVIQTVKDASTNDMIEELEERGYITTSNDEQ